MPRQTRNLTPEEIEQMLDSIDPSTLRDASHFRAIIAAEETASAAQRALVQAVIAARQAGDSWAIIGTALGVTRQAAEQRFGEAVRAAHIDAA